MPKKTKLAKGRLDKYYWLAKEQGYKSRAAFKLIQINKKFNFLQKAKVAIDLCAAPGGWTQVCAKHMPLSSLIVAIDIVKMKSIGGCQTIQGDITLKKTEAAVRRVVNELQADCVLNDGAPNVGGAWSKDAYGQCELSLHALRFATKFLRKDGLFVTKVFRSNDYNNLLWVCQQLFKKVHPFKPPSSRMSSAETFLVCEGYLCPKKIDPRLLDPTFVFKDVTDLGTIKNVLSKNYGKKTNREGYDTKSQSLLFSEIAIQKWLESDRPVDMLGKYNRFIFEENDPLLEKASFDIKEMCADLKLLGKRDFRNLLKWRLKLKKEMEKEKTKETVEDEAGKEEEVDDATKLKEKLETDLKEAERQQKKERKKRRRKKLEARRKMAAGANSVKPDITDPDLLSVKDIKNKELMDTLLAGEYSDAESENEEEDSEVGSDFDDFAQLEADLDKLYDEYRTRQGMKKKLKAKDFVLDEITEKEVEQLSDGEEIKDGLLEVKFEEDRKPMDKADKWFSQSIFDQVEESDSGDEMESVGESNDKADDEQEGTAEKEKEEIKAVAGFDPDTPYKEQLKAAKDTRSRRRRLEREELKKQESTMFFQEVSQDEDWSSDEEDAIAEVLAMGKQMLSKKKKERMIDASYNRYAFDDPDDLPKWFVEEEREHRTPVMPVTKQDVQEYKAYLKSVNARPLKKVAEAKARKKRKAMREWEKMKKQANTIADNSEMTERQKSKAIQKLYNKMKQKNSKKKPLLKMVSTKGGSRMQRKGKNVKGAKKVKVDRRMKKDARRDKQKKRGQKRKQSRGKSRGKGRKAKRRRN